MQTKLYIGHIGIILLTIALVFVGVALRNYLNKERTMTIAIKIWIRMALIFAAVGTSLFLMQFWK